MKEKKSKQQNTSNRLKALEEAIEQMGLVFEDLARSNAQAHYMAADSMRKLEYLCNDNGDENDFYDFRH